MQSSSFVIAKVFVLFWVLSLLRFLDCFGFCIVLSFVLFGFCRCLGFRIVLGFVVA